VGGLLTSQGQNNIRSLKLSELMLKVKNTIFSTLAFWDSHTAIHQFTSLRVIDMRMGHVFEGAHNFLGETDVVCTTSVI
jgi:hypothetical protein